ncbi:hypothetical protein D3C71_2113710 [compost metagenome]
MRHSFAWRDHSFLVPGQLAKVEGVQQEQFLFNRQAQRLGLYQNDGGSHLRARADYLANLFKF